MNHCEADPNCRARVMSVRWYLLHAIFHLPSEFAIILSVTVQVNGDCKIGIYANRSLLEGEEIVFNYLSVESKRSFPGIN